MDCEPVSCVLMENKQESSDLFPPFPIFFFSNNELILLQVEIKCMGQPVLPTLQLHNLVDFWLQTASASERVPALSCGSSGKEFVMVLAYARKLSS